MSPYLTERMVRQSAALAPLGEIAVQVRERLDGSGYPRGLSGGAISRLARLLGAAEAYQSMREPRPYRAARPAPDAAAELQAEVRRGPPGRRRRRRRPRGGGAPGGTAQDGGGGPDRPRDRGAHPAGPRRVEQADRGGLVITPKTAGNHVEHIYAKIGASSRAAAAMFAVQHGLLPEDEIAVPVR